ncbi:MAG: TetR/AcrR family transcriptional regulator [Desulfobacula sp.]|jgi:AcrR family transcriptional regulator|nr:TetR/AcrR family transcriptional regulator [Desulfobacula sp.]
MALTPETPVGKRREKQKAETYAHILESGRYLFETNGFEKTTIRAVASHAEIGLGTIYKHFNNKISLLAAALYDDLFRLFNEAIETMPCEATLKQQFVHLAGFNYRYYTSRPQLSREYLKHIAFVEDDWLKKIDAFDESYFEEVVKLVCAAQKRGEISLKKDCSLVAVSLLADYFFVLGDLFLRKKIADSGQMLSFLEKLIEQTIC